MPERQDLDAVLVAGDVTIDWNLATLRGQHSSPAEVTWWGDYSAQASWQYGGATLLANILRAVAAEHREAGQPGFEVRQAMRSPAPWIMTGPGMPRMNAAECSFRSLL